MDRLVPFEPSNATEFSEFTDAVCPGCSWHITRTSIEADPHGADMLDDPHAEWPGCPVIALIGTATDHTGHWYYTHSRRQGLDADFIDGPSQPYCKARREHPFVDTHMVIEQTGEITLSTFLHNGDEPD